LTLNAGVFNDGNWHTLIVAFADGIASLDVDSESISLAGVSNPSLTSNLFVGNYGPQLG
jgi:hypothetical protein